jgi:hypothetical protein
MSYMEYYKAQLNYHTVLNSRLLRFMDAIEDLDKILYDKEGVSTTLYYNKVCFTGRNLYSILPPRVKDDVKDDYEAFSRACLDSDFDSILPLAWRMLDNIINSLDKHNLLIPKEQTELYGER